MRRSFTPLLPSISAHHLRVVDGQPLVGVDRHTEEPRVGLEKKRTKRSEVLKVFLDYGKTSKHGERTIDFFLR